MKKSYTRARMVEHQKGENRGMLEFRFYDNNERLLCQRWVNGDKFRGDCERRMIEMQLAIEQSIYDGSHSLLVGPKVIMPPEKKGKVN